MFTWIKLANNHNITAVQVGGANCSPLYVCPVDASVWWVVVHSHGILTILTSVHWDDKGVLCVDVNSFDGIWSGRGDKHELSWRCNGC